MVIKASSGLAILLFILVSLNVKSQQRQNILEAVQIHLNSSSLITGETLLFSADVVSAETQRFSNLSSILYVEIINEDLLPIHQAKLRLKDGKGYGDFFITSLIPTGSYQLVAYTRWMKNFNQYYHHPIQIINPFELYTPNSENEKLNVTFHPEGGNLVSGVKNTVVVELTNSLMKGIDFKGRVVDEMGNVIANVNSIADGIALFSYTPKLNEQYQLIVEDLNGIFHFFDMPEVRSGQHTIQVADKNKYFLTSVVCDCDETFEFQVYKGPKKLYERAVESNTEFQLSKTELGEGTFLLKAIRGRLESKRLVAIKPLQKPMIDTIELVYSPRSLISIPVDFEEDTRFSISVNKVSEYGISHHKSLSDRYLSGVKELHKFNSRLLFDSGSERLINALMITSSWKYEDTTGEIKWLPDHRGEIVSGRITVPDTDDRTIGTIAYSIIGSEYQIKMAPIQEDGRFNVIIESLEEDRTAYVTSMDDFSGTMIEIDSQFLQSYPNLEFPPVVLDSLSVNEIVESSIRNQIENAYYETKPDSIEKLKPYIEQFGPFDYYYVLDDYNRFPTIKDSFVEYIPMVSAREKESKFKVIMKYPIAKPLRESVAFLDGLPVKGEEILAFSPYRIESIGVINNRYFMGPKVVDGIVSFRTKNGDLQGFIPGPQSQRLSYMGLSRRRIYTFPKYADVELGESDLNAKIPDYRDQLYWNPDEISSSESPYQVEFFTSDTKGKFVVNIEGVTTTGKIVSIQKNFVVE